VLTDSPKQKWTSNGVDTATLTCSVSGESDAVAVFATNAQSISATITDPNEFDWQNVDWMNVTWSETFVPITASINAQGATNTYWADSSLSFSGVEVELVFAAATGATVEAGIVVIGKKTEFSDPFYGLQQGLRDYSIFEEMSNGSEYYKQRDIVRTFTGGSLVDRDTEFYDFMHGVARTYGRAPKAWKVTDVDNFQWVVYARLDGMPIGSHAYPNHSTTTFNLIEVI
jgi:hypothetical protein